jgi:hypothetical protein
MRGRWLRPGRPGRITSGGQPAAEPAGSSPSLPDHPACQQILTAFADLRRPLRTRDLCQALDLPIVAKNTESIRSNQTRQAAYTGEAPDDQVRAPGAVRRPGIEEDYLPVVFRNAGVGSGGRCNSAGC